jgi:hypothetical protein
MGYLAGERGKINGGFRTNPNPPKNATPMRSMISGNQRSEVEDIS